MKESDEELVSRFFQAHINAVEDNGFTRRVMRKLPARRHRLSRLWSVLCLLTGIGMLTFGWHLDSLKGIFGQMGIEILHVFESLCQMNISPLMLLLMVITLAGVALFDFVSTELRYL